MADAKRCDITGEYFEPSKVQRKVIVQIVQPRGRPKTPDIGPTLQKKIEALLGISAAEPKKPKPMKRRKKKKAPKARKASITKAAPKPARLKTKQAWKRTPRMEFVMKRADELESEGLNRLQARKQAAVEWLEKETKPKGSAPTPFKRKGPKNGAKARINDPERCTYCGAKVLYGEDLCEDCQAGEERHRIANQA